MWAGCGNGLRRFFVLYRGRTADETLAALGEIGPHNGILLPACAGDVVDARGLGGNLPIEVNIHRTVDGNEVVQAGDPSNIVAVVHRGVQALRIVGQKVIQFLGPGSEGVGLAAFVKVLS